MSEYLENVIRASGGAAAPAEVLTEDKKEAPEGYHYMPDGTLMKDSDHEAALEKDADDPCWDGYVQVGMKKKNGREVPNCVPSAATIDYILDSMNSEFGVSRHVSKEDAYAVARKAYDKYEDLTDNELYEAVVWELQSFIEYATSGESEDLEDMSEYSSLLPEGHPATEPSITASAAWLAGAPDLDNSSRDAVLTAFSETDDYVMAMHATSRLRAIISSGNLSSKTLYHLKDLVNRYSKVD